jgi:hypothetical protein
MGLYFSDHFGVDPSVLEQYGALDISVVSDLPVFLDPFLLFNSVKPEYQELHRQILRYLEFLRDKAHKRLSPKVVQDLYAFREVKQNWLGFTLFGNGGQGLGASFAIALNESLGTIFSDFGEEKVTRGAHLEKLCLIRDGVGRDNISDLTTNLIKGYLLEYTEKFARAHLPSKCCQRFEVPRARFDYRTESWVAKSYYLPRLRNDFVLLTPLDILTCDANWISRADMINIYGALPAAIPDAELRMKINSYFKSRLSVKNPTRRQIDKAAADTLLEYPQLIDYYIKRKEETGRRAERLSVEKIQRVNRIFIDQVKLVCRDIEEKTDIYRKTWSSYGATLDRALAFKKYVETQGGYRVINKAGQPFSKEEEVQLFFGLVWCKTDFDVNREAGRRRNAVDLKESFGSSSNSLIEFKLGNSASLKKSLERQVKAYERANSHWSSVKVIVCYTRDDQSRVNAILRDLKLTHEKSIVVVDARKDNKRTVSML